MRKLFAVAAIVLGSVGLASVQASPLAPGSVTSAVENLGAVEAIHCTPNQRHHFPTFITRADGCPRPSADAPAKGKAKAKVRAKTKKAKSTAPAT